MLPRISFHGASKTVTGSCFMLETAEARVLVDCGMFQGSKTEKELNYRPFPFLPSKVDAVLLTHAHIDHSGLVPKLTKSGFSGPVFATHATVDLCSVMLPDAGYIQETEVEQLNRRNARRGRPQVSPIYTAVDATAALDQFRSVPYAQWITAAKGIRARYWNAGHLLGSASIEIEVSDDARTTRLLFSGDIGPDHKLLQFDPEAPGGFDYAICEATYGDTDRQDASSHRRRSLLLAEVREAQKRKGALLIPSFAVERTQELLVDLVGLMEAGSLPRIPIFIDSPLATKASAIFAAHADEVEDGDALKRALGANNVRFTETTEQSKAIDRIHSFYIVIAASGMCEAGRIRHHLKTWLWRDEATVLFVGYQAQGTLGRVLQDGASRVRIMGEDIQVRARIRTLDLYSGHADAPEIVAWVQERLPIRGTVFLVHGEGAALAALKQRLTPFLPERQVIVPEMDDVFDLAPDKGRHVPGHSKRIAPERAGRPDFHNELSRLVLDIGDAVDRAADERSKSVIIRRLRRALGEAGT